MTAEQQRMELEAERIELVRYLGTLATLALVTGLFVMLGDGNHGELALVGLLTFAGTSGRRLPAAPSSAAGAAVRSVGPLAAVLLAATLLGGCSAAELALAKPVADVTCVGLHKLCELTDEVCTLAGSLPATSGGETP